MSVDLELNNKISNDNLELLSLDDDKINDSLDLEINEFYKDFKDLLVEYNQMVDDLERWRKVSFASTFRELNNRAIKIDALKYLLVNYKTKDEYINRDKSKDSELLDLIINGYGLDNIWIDKDKLELRLKKLSELDKLKKEINNSDS